MQTHTRQPPGFRIEFAVDERSARATLRDQIAQLERRLADVTMERWASRLRERSARADTNRPAGRLLTLGELEEVRDELVGRLRANEQLLQRATDSRARARVQLEAILADPPAHRFEVVTLEDLGQPGCGAYQVLPRYGLLGMMFGWWCIKLSSGCP